MKKVRRENEQKICFGTLLKQLRLASGLSQGKVAKILGYSSPQFVSNWERGLSDPPLDTFAKLAEIYSVSLETLLNDYVQYRVQGLVKEIHSKFPKLHSGNGTR